MCTTGFFDLCAFLLFSLERLGGATDLHGKPSLNLSPTPGQLDLVAAVVACCDLMLDFGFVPAQQSQQSRPSRLCCRVSALITELNAQILHT